jgi:hypothetical protein
LPDKFAVIARMNLFERFWKTVDEKRDSRDRSAPAFDVEITALCPPKGARSQAATDIGAIVRRAARRYAPSVIAQPAFSPQPFCLIHTLDDNALPQFHELFEQYVDKSALIAETFLRLRPHCDLPYVLFLGDKSFFLYDSAAEELLRWGTDYSALEELFLQPAVLCDDIRKLWDELPRKTFSQRSEEFARWLDLWRTAIGARMNATPAFMQRLTQKILLLYLFDSYFGLDEEGLRLRDNFLSQRPPPPRRQRKRPERHVAPFDGIAWLYEAADEVRRRYYIDFLAPSQAETSFFSLMSAETRDQFSQFILELFLLSTTKFSVPVQADVFCDMNARLKLWKFSVTENLNIKRRLQVDDVNVYEPVMIDLEESGIGWALHVVEETLTFWKDRCAWFAAQLAERKAIKVQFDMFQQPDLENARVPLLENVFETAFASSVRIHYAFPAERTTLEYLVLLKVLEFCRQWNLALQPLHHVDDIFVQKERIGSVEEI